MVGRTCCRTRAAATSRTPGSQGWQGSERHQTDLSVPGVASVGRDMHAGGQARAFGPRWGLESGVTSTPCAELAKARRIQDARALLPSQRLHPLVHGVVHSVLARRTCLGPSTGTVRAPHRDPHQFAATAETSTVRLAASRLASSCPLRMPEAPAAQEPKIDQVHCIPLAGHPHREPVQQERTWLAVAEPPSG